MHFFSGFHSGRFPMVFLRIPRKPGVCQAWAEVHRVFTHPRLMRERLIAALKRERRAARKRRTVSVLPEGAQPGGRP
jgi:hypothetical protein